MQAEETVHELQRHSGLCYGAQLLPVLQKDRQTWQVSVCFLYFTIYRPNTVPADIIFFVKKTHLLIFMSLIYQQDMDHDLVGHIQQCDKGAELAFCEYCYLMQ